MTPRKILFIYGIAHALAMLSVTLYASSHQSIFDAGFLFSHVWFLATLADAYLGFLLFYFWLAWLERSFAKCLIWLILVLMLGNIAMGLYVALRAWKMKETDSFREFFCARTV